MKTFLNRVFVLAVLTVATVSGGCALDSPEPPTVTGPSTFFLSLTVTASPDLLPEDGTSQSVIRIIARDEHGQPLRNVQLRVDTVDGGRIVDFGTLSSRVVTTNAAGEATVTFTAPLAAIRGFDSGTTVEIVATPIGSDFAGANPRGVLIRLVPESVATVPGSPIASFSFSPVTPRPNDVITFNGSASSDDGTIVRYRWTFSDGHVEPDQAIVQHDFTAVGTYFVTLTVTDNENKTSSVTRAITVTSGS